MKPDCVIQYTFNLSFRRTKSFNSYHRWNRNHRGINGSTFLNRKINNSNISKALATKEELFLTVVIELKKTILWCYLNMKLWWNSFVEQHVKTGRREVFLVLELRPIRCIYTRLRQQSIQLNIYINECTTKAVHAKRTNKQNTSAIDVRAIEIVYNIYIYILSIVFNRCALPLHFYQVRNGALRQTH